MHEVSFESVGTMSQSAFRTFIERRARHHDDHHYELLNGRIVMNPPAGYPHGEIDSNVQVVLVRLGKNRGLGKVYGSSQGFDFPTGDTVEPDASFVSSERLSQMPVPEEGGFLRVVPDLAVEILSRSTATYDRGEKKAIYERNGVREYWLLDWRARALTIFGLEGGQYDLGTVFTEGETARSVVLQGQEFAVRELLP
jgi:Uma2 family endonuclease